MLVSVFLQEWLQAITMGVDHGNLADVVSLHPDGDESILIDCSLKYRSLK